MGAPAEVLEDIFTVIEGGKTIGDSAQIIQFPSDNGQRTFDAIRMQSQNANGQGLNYWVSAVSQGAAAISAGAIIVTVALPEFMALAVPCLGIAVGTAWYNIDPEGWTNLALLITDAGWTIKNKVVGFMTEKGILNFPPETIEILKNELARLGVFDIGSKWDEDKPESFSIAAPIISANKMYSIEFDVGYGQHEYRDHYYIGSGVHDGKSIGIGYQVPTTGYQDYKVTSFYNNDGKLFSIISSKHSFDTILTSWRWDTLRYIGGETVGSLLEYTYDNKKVYYYTNGNVGLGDSDYESLGTNDSNLPYPAQIAWIMQYGEFSEDYSKYQQKNAKLPDPDKEFPLTYPTWTPWEFPDIPGVPLPKVYPMQYPDLLPSEEPYIDPAQNPDGDEESADEGLKKLEDPNNDPANNPEAPPAVDPESSPEGDPISNPTSGENPDDPVNPDPPGPITPVIPIPPLPDMVNSNKLFTVYNPSPSQLDALGGYLWDNDLIDILRKIWQNPLDGIISLIQVYATPSVGSNKNIILGYLDSGVPAPVVTNQFATIDCGTIDVDERNENCLDYIPYTKLELYLPFIGVTEIDTNEFMSGSINIKYKVDVYTGTCLAEVKCIRNRDLANGTILYTFNGNCSQQIPLTSGDARGVLTALIGAAGLGLSIASGGAAAITGAGLLKSGARVAGELGSVASQEMLHVSHSGNLSANSGIMGQKKPYLIINRKRPYTATAYNRYYGFPANKTVYPGNHSGFLRLKAGRLQSAATEEEKKEIYELMTHGVIM